MQGLSILAPAGHACCSYSHHRQLTCGVPPAVTAQHIRHSAVRRQPLRTTSTAALPGVGDGDINAYVALGSAAAAFAGTFVIAPQFKDAFKEPIDWRDIYPLLLDSGLQTISPTEAAARAKRGAVLLDVRSASTYAAGHPTGSKGIPLYLPIRKWDLPSNLRRAGFAFFGIFGTELNEGFGQEALEALPRGKEVLVLCDMGGALENKSGTTTGFQSRSLKAAYYLQQAGFAKVTHVKGGVRQWVREGLPITTGEGPEDDTLKSEGSASAGNGLAAAAVRLLNGGK